MADRIVFEQGPRPWKFCRYLLVSSPASFSNDLADLEDRIVGDEVAVRLL